MKEKLNIAVKKDQEEVKAVGLKTLYREMAFKCINELSEKQLKELFNIATHYSHEQDRVMVELKGSITI